MASAQESCLVRLYKTSPDGNKTQIMQEHVTRLAPAGGAADAAAANVATPEKLVTINSPVELRNDDILEVAVILEASDGIDSSDCIWAIPLVTQQGTKTLNRSNFANPAFADITPPADTEVVIAGYRVVEGLARVSGKIYLDIQDDTA